MKNRNPGRRLAVVLTAVFLIDCLTWQWPPPARGQESVAPKRVLILYWGNKDYLWNVEFDQSFKFRLDSAPPGSIEYYQEYLDSDRFPGEPQARLLRDYLRKKYAEHPIDVVVATSDASLEFLIKDRSGLFPGVPIVFVATRHPSTAETTTEPGLTGIINIATHRRTVDLALSLHPTTEQVFVVSGTLEHDKRLERLARQELQGYDGRVQITYVTDLSSSQLVEKMESLPKRSIVLYVWEQSKNEQGKLLESVDLFALVAPHAHVPIYGMLLPLVGRGVVGGYVNTGAAAGTKIAEIVLRIATGTRAVDIPVERAPAQPIFDWRELRRWGISENKLPHESLIRFREVTLWDQYKWRILGIVVLILVQTMLIWGLLIQRRTRRKLYTELQRSEFYLAEGQRLAHTGSWALNPSGFFEYWSPELFQIYGLDPQKGAPTLEQYLATIHPQDRDFMAGTVKTICGQGSGCDVKKRIIRPDGAVRYVRCVGVPVLDNGVLKRFLGTAMDVTEQEQLTQELQSREAYLAEAQRLSHTGSFGWKPDTGEIVWSDETYRIFEYDRSVKPTIDSLMQRVHPQDRADFQKVIDGASRGATDFEHAYRLLQPDGRVKHVHAIAHAVQNASSDCEFVGAVSDITERKTTEDKIRCLVEADILGIFIANVQGEIVEANQAFLQMLQYGRQDLVSGRLRWTDLTPVELRERDERALTEALATGVFQPYEKEFLRKDGSRLPVLIGGALFQSANEGVVFVLDLSEQKRAESKIREQEMEFRQMLDLTPQLVAVFGPRRERLYTNRMALDYFGLSLDEWLQCSTGSDIHPDDVERLEAAWDHSLSTGSPYELELRVRKADGSYRWFLARYNPLCNDKGNIFRWYVAATDIEDRKQAEERLRSENVALREEIDKASMFEEIVGTSPALKSVLSRISKVAPSDSTVLITGETGTGKELVARAIHRRSNRASRAFVSLNCAATPRELIASELFGHEKGSFTGATQQRLGRFELANGGTIFLDEVGELPAETQIALLRVLQEHEFERVGGTRPIRADVRVIAATNRDLQAAISTGSFRSDLFYRLHVFPIVIPPLRERREDIPLLVEYFIDRYARKAGKPITTVEKRTLQVLQSYPWPGNIRELQNVIERSVIVCETENFSVDESWLSRQPVASEPTSRLELSRKFAAQEKEMIEAALRESRGRVSGSSGAAAKLGIPGSTLESKIRSMKINKNHFKTNPSADRT